MKAKERGVYNVLEKVDLLKKLPCSDNSVDYLTCVGTTTYLGKLKIYFFHTGIVSQFFYRTKSYS